MRDGVYVEDLGFQKNIILVGNLNVFWYDRYSDKFGLLGKVGDRDIGVNFDKSTWRAPKEFLE